MILVEFPQKNPLYGFLAEQDFIPSITMNAFVPKALRRLSTLKDLSTFRFVLSARCFASSFHE